MVAASSMRPVVPDSVFLTDGPRGGKWPGRWISMCAVLAVIGWLWPPSAADAQPPSPEEGTGGAVNTKAEEPGIRRVYVPVDELNLIFDRDKKGVLLPKAEFAKLYNLARDHAEKTARQPAGIVLSDVEYSARVANEQMLISAMVTFTQFSRGWQMLPLPLRGLAVERATLNDQPARLGRFGKAGTLHLLHDEPGMAKLHLELSCPLAPLGSDKVAAFGLIPSPSATLSVTLPAGKHLELDGSWLDRPEPGSQGDSIDQQAVYHIPVGGKSDVRLRITDQQTRQTAQSLVFATTGFGVDVSPGEVSWQAVTTLQVFGRALDRFVFSVPDALEIAQVDSSGLQAWELADSTTHPDRTTITLTYRQPVDGSRRIVFRGVTKAPADERWTVPNLLLHGAASHVGRVVVRHPPGVRLLLEEARGVRREESRVRSPESRESAGQASALDPRLSTLDSNMTFDVWQEDFKLVFVTQSKRRELAVDLRTSLMVTDQGLQLVTRANVETLYAPLFELDVTLPAGWAVTAVTSGGRPADWRTLPEPSSSPDSPDDQGPGLTVRIPLDPPLEPGRRVELRLTAHRDLPELMQPNVAERSTEAPAPDGARLSSVEVPLPEVRIPAANVVDGAYLIGADDEFEVVPTEINGLDPMSSPVGTPLAEEPGRLGYLYQDSRFSGRLLVSRKPARISAQTLTFTRLDPQAVRSHLEVVLDVQGGSLQGLDVALPETVGEDIRFFVPNGEARIVEQAASGPADGERLWTLRFDRRVRGRLVLAVDAQTSRPSPAGEDAGEGEFRPPVLRIPAAQRQNGYIAVEADGQQRLKIQAVDADGHPLPEVDPVDLPPAHYRPQERIVAVFRYVLPGYQVTFSEERYDRRPVPTAICHEARLTSLLAQTGACQHRAEYRLSAVGVQSLRVGLPDSAQLWAALIDGQPVEVRRVADAYVVPLQSGRAGAPATVSQISAAGSPRSAGRSVRSLELFYHNFENPLETFGRLEQQPPILSVVTGDGRAEPLDVLQQSWSVHYPQADMLIASDGRFHPVGDMDRTGLLGRLQGSLRIESLSQTLWKSAAIAGIVGFIVLLVLIYRRWEARGIVATVAVLGVGLILFALLLPATQQAREAARRMEARNELRQRGLTLHEGAGSAGAAASEVVDSLETGVRRSYLSAETAQQPPSAAKPGSETAETAPQAPAAQAAGIDQNISNQPRDFFLAKDLVDQSGRALSQVQAGQGGAEAAAAAGPAGGGGTPALGRLSVPIEMQVPEGFSTKEFRYHGTQTASPSSPSRSASDGLAAPLIVHYANRDAADLLRLFVAAAVLCGLWLLRRRSVGLRGTLGTAGLILPLALMTVLPVSWQIVLDGLFFGTLLGLLLWAIQGLVSVWGRSLYSTSKRGIQRAGYRAGAPATVLVFLAVPSLVLRLGSGEIAQAQSNAAPASDRRAIAGAGVTSKVQEPITVVVPYEPGEDPLKAERVFLPHDMFLELWNRAYPEREVTAPAPIEGVVAGALYSAEVVAPENGGTPHVAVTGRIVLHSFRDYQIGLRLPFGHVALREAKLDGQSAPLRTDPGNPQQPFQVLLDKAGLHLLDVEFDVPAERAGPAGRVTLPLHPVPAGRLTFTLPADGLDLRLEGAGGTYRKLKEGDYQVAEIPVDRSGPLSMSWHPERTDVPTQNIVHAEGSTAVIVDDSGVRLESGFLFRVLRGAISEATFSLPESLQVRQIRGADVGGWEIKDGARLQRSTPTGGTLRVFFRREITETTRVVFDLFHSEKFGETATSLNVPQLAPIDVTRESGTVAVFAGTPFDVRSQPGDNLTQMDAKEFHSPVEPDASEPGGTTPRLVRSAYRYRQRPLDLTLTVSRRTAVLEATAQHGVRIERRRVRLASRFQFQLKEAPKSRLAVQLPTGYLPLSVQAEQLADWYLTQADTGPAVLILELNSPRIGSVQVSLEGNVRKSPDADWTEIVLPVPLNVDRLQTTAAVWVDEAFQATLAEPENWRSLPPDRLAESLRSLQPRSPQFALQTTAVQPTPLSVALSESPVRQRGDAVVLVTVTDTLIHYTLALKWDMPQAPADAFVFTTPAWLADKLDFTAAGLRQIRQTQLDGGRMRWIVTLQEPQENRYFVTATASLPPPTDDVIAAPVLIFERPTSNEPEASATATKDGSFEPLETQQQFVLLINQSQSRLTAQTPELFEPAEPEALQPIQIRQTLIDQATELIRLRTSQASPTWRMSRAAPQRGAPAVVNLADLVTVLERDGTWRAQATYRVKNRARQFLAVHMPADSTILSVFVKGRPARPVETTRNDQPVHLIPLPKTSEADLSFEVQLVYSGRLSEGPLPQRFRLLRKNINLPAARVVSQKEDAQFGIPVSRTRWTIYLPEDMRVRPVDDPRRNNLVPVSAEKSALLGELAVLQEANQLFTLFGNKYSGRVQYRAISNLKQLKQGLPSAPSAGKVSDVTLQKVEQERTRFLSNLAQIERKIQAADEASRTIILDESKSLQVLDEPEQKRIIEQQAEQLFSDNTAHFVNGRTEAEGEPFGFAWKKPPEEKAKSQRDSMSASGKSAKPSLVDRRTLGRRKGETQLRELAEELEADKKAQRPADYERPNQRARAGQPFDGGGFGGQQQAAPQGEAALPETPVDGDRAQMQAGRPAGALEGPGSGEWTTAGGLSLLIKLPTEGQSLTFTKASGNPKLALSLWPERSLEVGWGLLWTIVWLFVGAGLVVVFRSSDAGHRLRRHSPTALIAVGLLTFLLLPSSVAWLGLLLFVLGAAALGFQHRRPASSHTL